jgi:arsenate reductase
VSRVRVLFLCTGNSARSQIAEALLKDVGGPDFEVYSAGTRPKGVNPLTLRVLQERGLDTSGLRSKSLDEFTGQRFDYVVTVCDAAAEECPFFPGAARQLHWSFPDPAAVEGTEEERLTAFRETERGMRERVQDFVEAVRKDAGPGRRQPSA